jgi:hypothetical protein
MIMVNDSAKDLNRFLKFCSLSDSTRLMVTRMVLAFILHRGRMSCSQAAGAIRCEAVHRSQVSRFLARPRWKNSDLNISLREALLKLETRKDGRFLFIIDATLCGQSGKKTQNTYSTGNRKRRGQKGRRYGENKHARRSCHSFTFGLLITPSGYRLPFQIPHYTKEYCEAKGLEHRTTAEAAADLIRSLPLPADADVVVLGDTAYDSKVVREACDERNYIWIFPANPERVFAGPTGQRPKLRSRLKDWTNLSTRTIRLRASTGKYAGYRRLSKWRVGPKLKPRVYYAHQEKQDVRSVGRVQLVFSTMKPGLKKASPDDVKILMTNALSMSLREIIELYSVRWQIELFFKELKSTLGFDQYRFENFEAVEGWVQTVLTTVLFLEWNRARELNRTGLSQERRRWWQSQRLHGLCEAFRQESESRELKYLSERLKTSGGIARLKRVLINAVPCEYRAKT